MRRLKAYVYIQGEGGREGLKLGNLRVRTFRVTSAEEIYFKETRYLNCKMFAFTGDLPPLQIIMKI